jgi:probable addiction module antidote protein
MIKTSEFDPAKYLKTPQSMADYLSEALETGDTEFICDALDVIDRAKDLHKSQDGTTKPEF